MAADEAKAAELFAAGESVNAVAEKLFNGKWAKAKKLHTAWVDAGGQVAAGVEKPRRGRKAAAAAEEVVGEEPESDDGWDLTLTVASQHLPQISAEFTPAEQAGAIQHVLQGRMDLALEG